MAKTLERSGERVSARARKRVGIGCSRTIQIVGKRVGSVVAGVIDGGEIGRRRRAACAKIVNKLIDLPVDRERAARAGAGRVAIGGEVAEAAGESGAGQPEGEIGWGRRVVGEVDRARAIDGDGRVDRERAGRQ